MYIEVHLTAERASYQLQEANDFRSFKVIVSGQGGRQDLSTALAPIGWLDESGDAYLQIDAVRSLAHGKKADPEWNASFDAMVRHAPEHGWVSKDCLQAHCEFLDQGEGAQGMTVNPESESATSTGLVRRYIEATNRWDFEALEALLSEHVVFEMPFAPPGFERRIEGREKLLAFIRTVPSFIDQERLHDVELFAFGDGASRVVATYKSDMNILPTGANYRNRYVSLFSLENGRITHFAEHYDGILLLEAMGGSVQAPASAAP
jgi:ketosteroid isomerase-like protein